MKKILILFYAIIALVIGVNKAAAQISVSINASANIISQPVWGPTGYDYARYYYMPDIDAYYSVPNHTFVYLEGGNWVYGASLPERFHYDLYNGYKVVVNEPRPYLHADVYRNKYSRYKGWQGKQEVIRDSRESRYYVIKDHPMHAHYHEEMNHGNNGHGRGNDGRDNDGNRRHGNEHHH
jgi:hypothetical protein